MFRFATPYAFLLLAAIPFIVWYRHRRTAPAMAHSGLLPLAGASPSPGLILFKALPLLYYLMLILLVAALARPQWGTERTIVNSEGINIILAVDLSESMQALDFEVDGRRVDRLQAVKGVVKEFIKQRSGDRIGLVVFGSQAYTQLPLTRDYQTIADILDRLEIGAAGRTTAVGDAIGISLKRLKDIESKSNIIILLTDGRSNSGELDPPTAAGIAKTEGVKIYTIGVGSKGRVPFVINDPIFGKRRVYQEVDLDENTLRDIADQTDGLYFRAQDTDGLQQIYNTIDNMETTEVEVESFAEYNELYLYFLLPAFGLLGMWILLKNTRFLSIP